VSVLIFREAGAMLTEQIANLLTGVSVLIFREAGAMLTEQIANLLTESECADFVKLEPC